ncbi:hypothetical protein EDB86DRAFT_2831707 [Lactarius hatsudake]|nr:hypothetical protein EDB86DRAFT_2831707 [Lactarius hatsudake]
MCQEPTSCQHGYFYLRAPSRELHPQHGSQIRDNDSAGTVPATNRRGRVIGCGGVGREAKEVLVLYFKAWPAAWFSYPPPRDCSFKPFFELLPAIPMSAVVMSTSAFKAIFDNALEEYKKKTGTNLTTHPLANNLQTCDSPDAVLNVLQEHIQAYEESRNGDQRLTKILDPMIHILYLFSAALGEGVGLTAKASKASHEALIDLFELVGSFLKRLKIYSGIPLTTEIHEVFGRIMVEILSILALSTKEIERGRTRGNPYDYGASIEVHPPRERTKSFFISAFPLAVIEGNLLIRKETSHVRNIEAFLHARPSQPEAERDSRDKPRSDLSRDTRGSRLVVITYDKPLPTPALSALSARIDSPRPGSVARV